MAMTARIAFETLRCEGVPLERIAGISKSSTTAVRLWQRGADIPDGAARRLHLAARVVMALKGGHTKPVVAGHRSELAAFAQRWLSRNANGNDHG